MRRKYWIGISAPGEHKPEDFKTFLVNDEMELLNVLNEMHDYIDDDFARAEEEDE